MHEPSRDTAISNGFPQAGRQPEKITRKETRLLEGLEQTVLLPT